ncbi:VWFA-related domain-containing protein [Granulicella pectinivorans]|uniref:VWFA-related domain-containing protein n=1 Tax=Granulicella pectinivorans TaxID=474950 RepID=A0A1I6M4N6_9BACT|nr:VWA domain-containing protein [Granulicella pectinivorans]SFS10641.1 VWFA-related domain-containing protein [Granulicella pectinivorans]
MSSRISAPGVLLLLSVFSSPLWAQDVTVLQARSRIVVVDVVATDSKGNPVKGLTAADFQLLEDKVPQTIRHFDEHATVAGDAPAISTPKMAPNTFTNVVMAPQGSALNVILVDALNTPREAQPMLRSQLGEVVDKLPPNTRVAVFALSDRVVMLQSFTSDPAVLKAVLTQRKRMPASASLQAQGGGAGLVGSDQIVGAFDPGTPIAMFERSITNIVGDQQIGMTLDALQEIGQYLAALPGRKNLIWLSGSFPVDFIPDINSAGGLGTFSSMRFYAEEMRKVSSELARSQVAVYPIDANGVQIDPAYTSALPGRPAGAVENDPGYNSRMSSAFSTHLEKVHGEMRQMGEQTGGHAFYGSNNLARFVNQAIERGANYYTLTYVPTNTNWNGGPRSIQVEMVHGKKINLEYRTGYLATDKTVTANNQQTTPESQRTAFSTVAASMKRGAPTPTEILFKIRVTPSGVIDPPAKAEVPVGAGPLAAVSRKQQRRYKVDYAVNPEDLHWRVDNGVRDATVEFMMVGYDRDGSVLNSASRTLSLKLTEANYAAAVKGGLQLAQEIAMPAKGDYYLRIGVMDKETNHVGSVEVSTATLVMPRS